MIHPLVFDERLKLIDPYLYIQWDSWKDGSGGRWVVYHKDRWGRPYKVVDWHDNKKWLPLDNRLFELVKSLDDSWDNIEKEEEKAADKVREDSKLHGEAEGKIADGLEIAYRTGTGLKQFALGAPSKPATPGTGYYSVVDKRRFKHLG